MINVITNFWLGKLAFGLDTRKLSYTASDYLHTIFYKRSIRTSYIKSLHNNHIGKCQVDLGRLEGRLEVPSWGRFSAPVSTHISNPSWIQIHSTSNKTIDGMYIHPNPHHSKNRFYLYRVKILAVHVSNILNLEHISQSLLYPWDLALLLCSIYHVLCRFGLYRIVLS